MFSAGTISKRIFDSPIRRLETQHLRGKTVWLRRVSHMLLALACLTATLPLWIYITDDYPTYLLIPLMVGTIYTAHLVVAIRTVLLASLVMGRELQPGRWDTLILTGLDARQILLGKWWAVLREVWPEYILLAFLKGGLAFGLAQLFDTMNAYGCIRHFGTALCYGSYPVLNREYPAFPSIKLWLFGMIILIAFTLIEAGVLIALGQLGSLFVAYRHAAALTMAFLVRITLVVLALLSWWTLERYGYRAGYKLAAPYIEPFSYNYYNFGGGRFRSSVETGLNQIAHTAQFTMATFADDGTVLIADFLRPYAPPIYLAQRLLSATISLLLYAALLEFVMRLTEWRMVRKGALRPT